MKSIKMLMMAALTILTVSVFAQGPAKTPKAKTEKIKYSCPMHADVVSAKEGKCSKCGMDLTKTKKEQMKMMKTYSCPMKCEGDKTYDKEGKCPVCKMNLKEKAAASVAKSYSCPMKCEGDKTYDKEGKCPKCGMDLKEKKEDHANHQH